MNFSDDSGDAAMLASGAISGLVLAVLIIAAAFAAGATFGQRCARMYPQNPVAQEQCVAALAHGGCAL